MKQRGSVLANRWMPPSIVTPEPPVRDVHSAGAWLEVTVGVTPRLMIGDIASRCASPERTGTAATWF